ncbi:luciferase domain-containing protein [Streptomyces sp. NPDC002643]
MTLAQRALRQLETWSDLSVGPASCGTGRALRSRHDEIVHFHLDHDVDLHLTPGLIQRMAADLGESSAVRLVPGSRWVTVHLDCEADVDLLLSLVSVALKAHQAHHPHADHQASLPAATTAPTNPPAGCNFRRVTVLPRVD